MPTNRKFKLTKKRKAWAGKREEQPVFAGTPLAYNAGVAAKYEQQVSSLTAQMTAQVKREITKLFKSDAAGQFFGQDASIASQSRILMATLQNRFASLFAVKAPVMAEAMVASTKKASASALHSSLQKLSGGMSLKTSLGSAPLKEITTAAVAENVGLIKSIAQDYLKKVEGAVYRSITSGQGLKDLIPFLSEFEGQTHRRAKNIALDQTRKTYNGINGERMKTIGIKKFKWLHSGGGAHPREDHVAMNGQIYELANPPIIDRNTGERGLPGRAINCRCSMAPVYEFTEAK